MTTFIKGLRSRGRDTVLGVAALAALSAIASCGDDGTKGAYVTIYAPKGEGHKLRALSYEGNQTVDGVELVPREDGAVLARLPVGGQIIHEFSEPQPSGGFFERTTYVDVAEPGDVISIGLATEPLPEGCLCQRNSDPAFDYDAADLFISVSSTERSYTRRILAREGDEISSPYAGWYLSCADQDFDELRGKAAVLDCGMDLR